MNIIQLLLFLVISLSFLVYIKLVRSVIIDRVVCLTLFLLASLAVIFPDATTSIAHAVGVGRGADLLLYTFASVGAFIVILLYSKIERLSQVQTKIIRTHAIENAKKIQELIS